MAWQRKTPFGYMVRGGEIVPCPAEADAVQDIFTRYLAGASFSRIAEETGYPSFAHFSKQFKKFVGMSPNEYRRKGEEENGIS